MNILSVIIFFLLLPTFIVCILAIIEERRKKQIKRNLKRAIRRLVGEDTLSEMEIEYFRHKAIGIDRKNKKLLFVDIRNWVNDQFSIDLETLIFCRVVKTWSETSRHIEKVFIEVRNKTINEVSKLTFYDRDSDNIYVKPSLIGKAEYWRNKIKFYRRPMKFNHQFEYVL